MNEYQQKQTHQAAREASSKKLRERLNHQNPIVRKAAEQELERRKTIAQMQEAQIQIGKALQPVDYSTLTENAVEIEVEVSTCEANHFEIPYTYKGWWYDTECIAFAHDILGAEEAVEWLNLIREEGRDTFNDEPVNAILDGKRMIIFDIPLEHFEYNGDDYQIEFARKD